MDMLLERGTMALADPKTKILGPANKWTLEPIYKGKDCSIGFVYIPKVELGPCEEHVHHNSIEYLIVVKGSIILNINGRNIRIVKEGECCVVEPGSLHYSKPLTDDTKLAYVCVPSDDDIPPPTGTYEQD